MFRLAYLKEHGFKNSRPLSIVEKEIASKEVTKKTSRNVKFSPEEDQELLRGIKKHGEKNWAAIIKDEILDFHPSRTRDSLRVRADSAAFKKLTKKQN